MMTRCLRCGLLIVLCCVIAAAQSGVGVQPQKGAPSRPSSSNAENVQNAIQQLTQQIAGMQVDLKRLQAELDQLSRNLKDLMAAKPVAPGSGATKAQKEAYDKSLSSWQSQVDLLKDKIERLQSQIASKKAEIAAAQKKLQAYQSSNVPRR